MNGRKLKYITRWMGRSEWVREKLYRFLCQRHFVVAELFSCFDASAFTCLLLCDMPSQASTATWCTFRGCKSIFVFFFPWSSTHLFYTMCFRVTLPSIVTPMNFGTWLKISSVVPISLRMFPMSASSKKHFLTVVLQCWQHIKVILVCPFLSVSVALHGWMVAKHH